MGSKEVKQEKKKKIPDLISVCNSLLKHNKNILFLEKFVMGDEKWILYNNVEQEISWESEMNHNEPHQRPVFFKEGDVVYMVGSDRSLLSFAPSDKPNN